MTGNTQKILKNKKFVMVDPVEHFDFKFTSVYVSEWLYNVLEIA